MTSPKNAHLPQRCAIAVLAMACIGLVLVIARPPRSSDEDNLWGAWLSVAVEDIASIRMRPSPDLVSHNCGTILDSTEIVDRTRIQHVTSEMRGLYPLSTWFRGVKHWKATEIFYLDFVVHDRKPITFVIMLEKDGMTAGYHLEKQSRLMYVSEPLRSLLSQARNRQGTDPQSKKPQGPDP